MVQEFECVCCSHSACVSHYFNTTVMVEGWGKIPCLDGMVPPCVPLAWFDMDHAFSINGGHGGSIEGKCAFHGFLGGEIWVLGAGAHHVESDAGLFKVLAPVGQAVGGRSSCSDGNEMVLPHSDGSFSWIGLVNVWWRILVFCIIFCNEFFNIT